MWRGQQEWRKEKYQGERNDFQTETDEEEG